MTFTSQAGAGVTTGDISCKLHSESGNLGADSGSTTNDKSYSDLLPGTYDCTIVIDP